MNIGFEYPAALALGLVFIPLALFVIPRFFRALFVLTIPLGAPGGLPFKPPFRGGFLLRILRGLELSGVLLLFIAAAGPLSKSAERVWLNRGADILFVLDISPSMAGIDMNGRNRFDAARELIRAFAEDRPADAIGLVAVGYDAALMVPPTVDRRALSSRLESLRIAELGDGTALGMGLALAALHLRDSPAPRRAVVLLSDGENNAGAVHPLSAAPLLRDLGISLWVVGIGSGGEIPIDYVDPFTRMRRTGLFDSRFDAESLRAVAQAGEGIYIAAPSGEALTAAFSRIAGEERTVSRSGLLIRQRKRHGPLIVLALILLAGSRFLRRCLLGGWV
ncbi:MAG: VWA domain-containing protein [Treponema sp.]|jgi:Ca-activated chloride channel family protein|nr:VWA domain-containing protein [Treponema sp.]